MNKVIVSKTVGDINITCEASSDVVSMEVLRDIADRATTDQTVTGHEGVELSILMVNPESPKPHVIGVSCGKITPAAELLRQQQETEKFNDELEHRTSEQLRNATGWLNSKTACLPANAQGFDHMSRTAIHEIAKGWAHTQMLQEEIRRQEKVRAECLELIDTYKRQINELQHLLGERSKESDAKLHHQQGYINELEGRINEYQDRLRIINTAVDTIKSHS